MPHKFHLYLIFNNLNNYSFWFDFANLSTLYLTVLALFQYFWTKYVKVSMCQSKLSVAESSSQIFLRNSVMARDSIYIMQRVKSLNGPSLVCTSTSLKKKILETTSKEVCVWVGVWVCVCYLCLNLSCTLNPAFLN